MNKTTITATLAIILGLIIEFVSYWCAAASAASTDGTAFLWFLWAAIAFCGGAALIAIGGYINIAPVLKELKDD